LYRFGSSLSHHEENETGEKGKAQYSEETLGTTIWHNDNRKSDMAQRELVGEGKRNSKAKAAEHLYNSK